MVAELKAEDRKKLTKTEVERIPVPEKGATVRWDSVIKGFGVRVAPSGRRSYFVQARTNDGTEGKKTLGVHGMITADQARTLAKKFHGAIAEGRNPFREAQEAKQAARERKQAPTVADLCREYIERHAIPKKRPRSVKEDQRIIAHDLPPALKRRKVADVTHADIERIHNSKAGSPYAANRTVALLSKMFSLAVKWGYRPDNPARGIERFQEEKRERYLKPGELERLARVLDQRKDRTSANAIKLLILTGARRGEVFAATWSQFDLASGVWVKPSSHTKQKKEHRVPLSAPAVVLLSEMKEIADQKRIPSPYVFPGKDPSSPITDLKKSWASICKEAGIEGVRLHDLRHSFASLLASSGRSLPIIGRLLGHTQAQTTARYAHLADDPLKEATDSVGAIFESARTGKTAEIVPIEKGRQK